MQGVNAGEKLTRESGMLFDVAKVVLAGLIWPDLFASYGDVASAPPPSVALYSLLQLHCRGLLKEHIIILTRSTLWGLLQNTQTRACVCAGAMW